MGSKVPRAPDGYKHEYAKSGNVVPGVAGCIGILGKLRCDPGGTVIDEDTFKYRCP